MGPTQVTAVEAGNRVQLPAEWSEALGLRGLVTLERTDDGILIRPGPQFTWEEIFATKLQVGSAPPDEDPDEGEVTGDDFLF